MSGDSKKSIFQKRWVQTSFALCTAVVLYLFLSNIHILLSGLGSFISFVSPVLIGLVMAYIMNPLCSVFEKQVFKKVDNVKNRHRFAVLCTITAVILILTLLLIVLIPQLFKSVTYLVRHIHVYTAQLQGFVDRIAGMSADKHVNIQNITKIVNDILESVTSSITGNYDTLVDASVSFGKQVLNYLIAFILAVYFLLDKDRLLLGCNRLMQAVLRGNRYNRTKDFLSRCNTILVRYIAFDLIDGLMVGCVNYLFMKITGMPYAGLISIVVGVANLAPTFGPIVGCALGAFILVLINPLQALIFIIFTILLQVFDGYIFKPRLFGATLGVSSIWILIFIIVGGRMFGIIGILVAIPTAAIVDFVYHETIIARLEERRNHLPDNDLKSVGQTLRDDLFDTSETMDSETVAMVPGENSMTDL